METVIARYRVKGTTDDETTCGLCGKVELQKTVILAELDADGTEGGTPIHAGVDCAARATGVKATRIRSAAAAADSEAARRVEWATGKLAVFGPVEHDTDQVIALYVERNRVALQNHPRTPLQLMLEVMQMLSAAHQIVDAKGIPSPADSHWPF